MTLDLRELDFIDSSGLGVLVGARRRLGEVAGTLEICGLRQPVRRVFEIAGLAEVFTITG